MNKVPFAADTHAGRTHLKVLRRHKSLLVGQKSLRTHGPTDVHSLSQSRFIETKKKNMDEKLCQFGCLLEFARQEYIEAELSTITICPRGVMDRTRACGPGGAGSRPEGEIHFSAVRGFPFFLFFVQS